MTPHYPSPLGAVSSRGNMADIYIGYDLGVIGVRRRLGEEETPSPTVLNMS